MRYVSDRDRGYMEKKHKTMLPITNLLTVYMCRTCKVDGCKFRLVSIMRYQKLCKNGYLLPTMLSFNEVKEMER